MMCIILFILLFVCLFIRVLSFLCCVARRGITAHRRRIMYIMYSLVLWWGKKWVFLCFDGYRDCYGGCDYFYSNWFCGGN